MHIYSSHVVSFCAMYAYLITNTYLPSVFSAFLAVGESSGVAGDAALELSEQKTNVMVLDLCHKPGGSEYLRRIYHIMRLNEVGKRSFYRAIRCVLAWGSVCWQLRVVKEVIILLKVNTKLNIALLIEPI